MASVKEIVDSAIASNDVMMFSKSYCPYCDMAKQALKEAGVEDYEVMGMENRKDCSQMQDYLKKITGARSVPRVFIHGKCIGGGSEAKALQIGETHQDDQEKLEIDWIKVFIFFVNVSLRDQLKLTVEIYVQKEK